MSDESEAASCRRLRASGQNGNDSLALLFVPDNRQDARLISRIYL